MDAANAAKVPFGGLKPQTPINTRADAYGRTALGLSRLAAMTVRCELDVPYGKDAAQRLDVYLPKEKKLRGLPVLICFHGGGHTHGYKEWMGLNAPAIVSLPAIFVSVEYRLAPSMEQARSYILTQLDDTLAATRWVLDNVARYGGDSGRIHIGGHSAGAVLSALATLRRDLYGKFGLPQGVIKACFPVSGSYDVRDPVAYGDNSGAKVDAALANETSCMAHVAGNKVRFFVTWGGDDNVRTKAQSPAFVMALNDEDGVTRGHRFEQFDHFWIHVDQQNETNLWTRTVRAWMSGDFKSEPKA